MFLLLMVSMACTDSANTGTPTVVPTPTPNAGEIALAMMQKQMSANATAQYVGLNFTATAQILGATATQQQLIINAQGTEQARVDANATSEQQRQDAAATSEQRRVDAQSTQARIDSDARATQAFIDAQSTQARADADTLQARVDAVSTQDALSTATFTSLTLTAIPPHATLTQLAVNNQIAISTQEVERSALSLKQARDTNVIVWLTPIIIAVFAAIVGAFWIYNQGRVREIRDEDGNVDVFIFDNRTATKPSLLTGPVLDLRSNTMPMLAAPKVQEEVTRRAQAIKALAAMPVQPTVSGAGAFNSAFTIPQSRNDAFEIIDDDDTPPAGLLDAEALKATEQDWKEANEK
jgi:hypothetical protein